MTLEELRSLLAAEESDFPMPGDATMTRALDFVTHCERTNLPTPRLTRDSLGGVEVFYDTSYRQAALYFHFRESRHDIVSIQMYEKWSGDSAAILIQPVTEQTKKDMELW